MGLCDSEGVEQVKAFDNKTKRWWCRDHAELAKANVEAERMFGNDEH